MYEDNNYKVQINWKNLLLKLSLIVIIVLLIIWLFPMPKLDTFYNKVFNDNLNSVKSVAENYFTNDNLPTTTGSSVTLKLQDMLDKKLITSFVDKNNNSCNTTNSYAQVTKTEDNTYVLKVQLSCDDKTDYILENIATAAVSSKNSSVNNTDSSSTAKENTDNATSNELKDMDTTYDKDGGVSQYQYKKAITKTSTSYTCPSGYVKENNICYKYETGETIPSTPLYFDDVTTSVDAKKNTTGEYTVKVEPPKTVDSKEKVCPTGYTLNGKFCYKYEPATVVPGSTTYSCDDGFTLNGTTCTRTVDADYHNNESTYYQCSEGTLSGSSCIITISASRNSGSSYQTCDNGGSLSNGTCILNATYHSGNTSCSCPSDTVQSGTTCIKTSTVTYWSNPTTTTSSYALSVYNNGSSKRILASKNCTLKKCTYVYYIYTLLSKNNYSYVSPNCSTSEGYYTCSYGSLSGSSCYYSASTHSSEGGYYCPSGYSQNGSTCTKTIDATKITSGSKSYSCASGYTLSGTKCTKNVDATPHTTETKYTCPAGYVKEGTTCYQYTEATEKINYKYTCPANYTQSGTAENTTCSKIVKATTTYYCEDASEKLVDNKCIKTTKGGLKGYTCPDGYVLNTDKCVKKTTTCMKAEEVTNTYKSYEYKWSSETSLDGCERTGKTKTKTSTNEYEK